MNILVSNDDGISAPGLLALVKALSKIAQVTVVAPQTEQSAIGTAITLRHPLRVRQVEPLLSGVATYAVAGTPADSVILALDKLLKDQIDLVITGINNGPNLGGDVLMSGTVGAALQGYLRGIPAIAMSIDAKNSPYLDNAASLAVLLAKKLAANTLPADVFLNVNLPNLPTPQIKGAKITYLATKSHTDTVEERDDPQGKCYWLVRQHKNHITDNQTDVWAIEQGNISITPLNNILAHNSSPVPDSLSTIIMEELRES